MSIIYLTGASHILEAAVWLNPVPFFAEDLRDLSATFFPVLVDSGLNKPEIGFGDGPFSNGKG